MKKLELSLKGTPWAQNFGVQELNAKEMIGIDGGGNPVTDFLIGYVGGKLLDLAYDDWKSRYGNNTHATQTGHYASMGPY